MSEGESVSVAVDIENGRTTITVSGDRDAAVIVRSASGERIYLPPEDFEREAEDGHSGSESPYQSASDSPYQAASDSPYQSASDSPYQSSSDSPYQASESDSPYQSPDSESAYQSPGASADAGLEATADGFRIVHPEEVTDVRLLR